MLLPAAFRTQTDTFTNGEYLVIDFKSLLGHPVLIRFLRVSQQSADSLPKFAVVVQLTSKKSNTRGRLRGNILGSVDPWE